jgi:hypothetical protein
MLVVALVALIMVLTALSSARRSATEHTVMPMRLSLSNLGNVATGYLVRAEDAAGILNFRFSLNGVALGLPPVARLTDDASIAQSATGAAGGAAQAGRPAFGGIQLPNLPQSTGEGGEGTTLEGMADKLEEASMVGRIIADILYTVAMFLPRPLSQSLRMIAMQIRRGQMLANRVKYVRRQVERLNKSEMGQKVVQGTQDAAGQVGRAATSETTRGAVAQGAGRAGGVLQTTAAAAVAGAKRTASSLYDLSGGTNHDGGVIVTNGANGVAAHASPRQWVYVPPISPGETVTIDVMVAANARRVNGEHQPFRIFSRALGEENAPPVIEEGSIRISKSSPWPALMRYLLAGVVVLVAIALIWLLAGTLF